ncbi:MAG: carboxypeptidase-like regulatory domain-containing protein [Rhodothermaceae bacterium]|nr:carboxypeptidase-like regulatory domain-containing protein [Rhodothermaceae bacterium]
MLNRKRLIMLVKMFAPFVIIMAVLVSSAFAVPADTVVVVAEDAHLSGYVWDAVSETAVAGIEVKIDGYEMEATTNEEGYFSFETLEPGEYTVKVDLEGYEAYEQVITVNDEPVTLNILLERSE